MTPFFSIIIPVYNVAPYLRECLDSVLAQTFTDWEAICVDDGSTDDSLKILYEFALHDARFKILHQSNSGVAVARNTALDVVSGSWVLFLDGDDLYAPNSLMILASKIRINSCDIVFFGTQRFNDSRGVIWSKSSNQVSVKDTEQVLPILLSSSFSGGQAYKWELVRSLRQERFQYGEDMLYLTQALVRSSKILKLDNYIYGYRMRRNSAMHRGVTLRYFEDLINTRFEALIEVSKAGKLLDAYSARWIGGEMTEEADRLLGHLSRAERLAAISVYLKKLSIIIRLDVGLRSFDIIRLRIICLCPIMRYVLCRLPRSMREVYSKILNRL